MIKMLKKKKNVIAGDDEFTISENYALINKVK